MKISVHSHSGQFCQHAQDTLEQIVQRAIEVGYTSYGLSEHMPRYVPAHLYPEEAHLTPADLQRTFVEYLTEAHRLKVKYHGRIRLLVGVETEVITRDSLGHIQGLVEFARDELKCPIEYLVGSVHHAFGAPIDFSQEMFDTLLLKRTLDEIFKEFFRDFDVTGPLTFSYFEAQFQLVSAFKPAVIGHFDLVRKYCKREHVLSAHIVELMKRNITLVVEYGGLFELNSRSLASLGHCFPFPDTIALINSLNGKFTYAEDAHALKDVGKFDQSELLSRFGISEFHTLSL